MTSHLTTAAAEVGTELARVDTKASTLLAAAGIALTIGLAILGRADLPHPAAATGRIAAGLVGLAVVALALAVRPRLAGDYGFMRWAATTPDHLDDTQAVTPTQLVGMARLARTKYRLVRAAVDLLLASLAATAITAVLA